MFCWISGGSNGTWLAILNTTNFQTISIVQLSSGIVIRMEVTPKMLFQILVSLNLPWLTLSSSTYFMFRLNCLLLRIEHTGGFNWIHGDERGGPGQSGDHKSGRLFSQWQHLQFSIHNSDLVLSWNEEYLIFAHTKGNVTIRDSGNHSHIWSTIQGFISNVFLKF